MTFNIFLIIVHITNAYAVSVDCPNMINLGLGVGLKTRQPAIWTQLNVDCCTATGVTCVGQRVTQLSWSGLNLTGIINATAIPSGLQYLWLSNNQLTGPIPSTWPNGIQRLYLDNNQLTGPTPSTWPNGLQQLYLHYNYLTGSIPSTLPSGLQYLALDNNQLTGSIPSTWPSGLQRLYLSSNQLTGSIPSTWPSGLQILWLRSNQLTGSISNTWPSGLLELGLHNNYLTGDVLFLPSALQYLYLGLQGDTKYNRFTGKLVLNKPIYLLINNNWITDVVVYDSSLLSNCDLSNNPLLGNPNLNNLTMCITNELYKAGSLPNSMSSIAVTMTTLVTRTTSDTIMQKVTETSILSNSEVSIVTQTGTAVNDIAFIFVAQDSMWRLTWTIMVKLIINAMILTTVVTKKHLRRELKAKFSSKTEKTKDPYDLQNI